MNACLRQGGFTAIELMVVLSIMVVLATLAAPSFTAMIQRWRVQQSIEELSGTFYLARSEAMRRGVEVHLMKLDSGADCTSTTATDWSCGWILYADLNRNGKYDSSGADADFLIQNHTPAKNMSITYNDGDKSIVVNQWGDILKVGGSGISFEPKSHGTADMKRTLCIIGGGKIYQSTGTQCS